MAGLMSCLIAFVVSGCGSTQPVPEDTYYRVEVSAGGVSNPEPLLKGGLLVDRLQVDALRSGRAIVYREVDQPLQLHRYHYHFWAEPPARMAQQQLTTYLQKVSAADYVFNTDHVVSHRYRLTGRLVEFDRIIGKAVISSSVELRFVLTRRGDARPLLSRTYRAEIAADGPGMHAFARATQQALGQVLDSLNHDIRVLVTEKRDATL